MKEGVLRHEAVASIAAAGLWHPPASPPAAHSLRVPIDSVQSESLVSGLLCGCTFPLVVCAACCCRNVILGLLTNARIKSTHISNARTIVLRYQGLVHLGIARDCLEYACMHSVLIAFYECTNVRTYVRI